MNATRSLLQVFQSRKMAALLLLGFSSGLPLFLTSRTLQYWMTEEKVDLGIIGLFAIVALPYSLKFLWSPLLDRFVPPFMGRRRGWLVITQVGLVLAIAAMALQKPAQNAQVLQLLAINALIITFLSATQDIAGDAYRTDVLKPLELETGASLWVLGYRLALLVTGFLAVRLAAYLPWNLVYLVMAAVMGVGIITSFWTPEAPGEKLQNRPMSIKDVVFLILIVFLVTGLLGSVFIGYLPINLLYWVVAAVIGVWLVTSFLLPTQRLGDELENPPQSLQDAVTLPFQEFFQRFGLTQGSLILIFILLYKLGDGLVGNMAGPFLIKIEFSKTQIADIQGGMGFLATTVGVLVGGAILTKLGINRCLWIFGGLQLLSNFGYYALAKIGNNYSLLVLAINLENFCAGLVTVVTVAFLMSLCNHNFTTTQFALFSSLTAISRDILSAPAGELAKATGWATFFLITVILSLPGLLLLPFVAPWNPQIVAMPTELDDQDSY